MPFQSQRERQVDVGISIAAACLVKFLQGFVRLAGSPDRAEVVVVVSEVAHGLCPHAAGPDVSVGGYLRRGHPGHAGDHLPLLAQRPLHDLVVLPAERLGDLGYPR